MTPTQLINFKTQLHLDEGWVAWPYLDTNGFVTAGCGHKILNFEACLALPWKPDYIGRDWQQLIRAPKGMPASAYAIYTEARLSDASIAKQLDADIGTVERTLRTMFRGYAGWPPSADAAMCDVAFNAGLGRFLKLVAAAGVGDWATCANECHRIGISEARNQRTADLFRQAAQGR